MLVLSRHRDESIVVDFSRLTDEQLLALRDPANRLHFTIIDIRGDKVRVGCQADPSIGIHRREVMDAIDKDARRAAKAG